MWQNDCTSKDASAGEVPGQLWIQEIHIVNHVNANLAVQSPVDIIFSFLLEVCLRLSTVSETLHPRRIYEQKHLLRYKRQVSYSTRALELRHETVKVT